MGLIRGNWTLVVLLVLAAGLPACSREPRLAERDLLRELRQATVVEETLSIDVGTLQARPLLGAGWSVDETVPDSAALQGDTSFVWATAGPSELRFLLVEPRQRRLYLALRPFWYPGAEPLRLAVSINGHRLQGLELNEGDHLASLDLPADWLLPNENRLRLEPSRSPVAAEALPASRDPRRLSAAVFYAALGDPSGPPPVGPDGQSVRAARAARAAASDARGPPTAPPDDPTEICAPADVLWSLRAREGTQLEYGLELESGAAGVGLQWLADGEVEGLGRQSLVGGWLGRRSASGTVEMPVGPGTLRLRLEPAGSGAERPCVRLRSMRLRFPPPPRPLNLLWITLDTTRADHLGSFGHPEIHTPTLDRLARRGAVLSAVESHIPITGPAHSSMFTGRYPLSHGVQNNGQALPLEEETLAEYLKAYGWQSSAVVSLVVLHSNLHFSQGFDRYVDCAAAPWWRTAPEVTDRALDQLDLQWPEKPLFLWVHYSDPHEPYTPPGSNGAELTLDLDGTQVARYAAASGQYLRAALRLKPGPNKLHFRVGANGTEPFLGALVRYLAFDSPLVTFRYGDGFTGPNANGFYRLGGEGTVHVELAGRAEASVPFAMWAVQQIPAEESRRRYAAEVELVDREVGRLLQGLAERGLAERTLVLVNSDHGEGLWSHGQPGHVEQLYEEALHSPVLLALPGALAPQVRGLAAQHIDLLPTVLDVLDLPPKRDVQGRSVAFALADPRGEPLKARPEDAGGSELFLQTFAPEASTDRRALVRGRWKLIVTAGTGKRELYDLAADPAEHVDRSAEQPEVVQQMVLRLLDLETSLSRPGGAAHAPSAMDQEKIKALGYVR